MRSIFSFLFFELMLIVSTFGKVIECAVNEDLTVVVDYVQIFDDDFPDEQIRVAMRNDSSSPIVIARRDPLIGQSVNSRGIHMRYIMEAFGDGRIPKRSPAELNVIELKPDEFAVIASDYNHVNKPLGGTFKILYEVGESPRENLGVLSVVMLIEVSLDEEAPCDVLYSELKGMPEGKRISKGEANRMDSSNDGPNGN